MRDDEFWALISLLDWDAIGDDEQVLEPLIAALAGRGPVTIEQFAEALSLTLYALDTQGHARAIGDGAYVGPEEYFSHDLFLYARCAVVANGRKLYEEVLRVPARFPPDVEFEPILTVAEMAYERATGRPLEFSPSVSYETGSNRFGWEAG